MWINLTLHSSLQFIRNFTGTFYQHLIKLYRCCDLADEVSWIQLLLCSVCVCVICSWRFKSIQFYLYNTSSQQRPFQGALYFKENIFPYWREKISLIRCSPTKNLVAVGRKNSLLKWRDLHQNKEHWEDKTQIYWKWKTKVNGISSGP